MDDGKIIIKAQIDSSEVDSGLSKMEGKVNKSANNLMGILKGVGFTALVAKASQVAIKFAKEVNQATEAVSAKLKGASTLYQGVAVDQENLLKGLSGIATQTGESLETLGQSVYDALSAGVKPTEDMADVLKVVEASAKLAKGGFTDTSTALSSTLKVMNSYSMGMKDLDRVQGILIQTQNSGITTVDELGASLAQVVPTASSFGVSFENVGAAIAEMTKQGTKTAQATTALNAIIAELGKNGTKASNALKESAENAGLAETDFRSMLDSGMSLADILGLMEQNASANGLSMVDMFSSIEAGKGALQLTGKAGDDFNSIMDSMQKSTGLVQEAFEKTVDPSEQLNAAWNNLLVTIGTKFKPTADGIRTSLADTITKMAGQKTAGENLASTIETVVTASKNLKTAQEEVESAVSTTTKAMLAQTRQEFMSAMQDLSDGYSNSMKTISGMRGQVDDMTNTLAIQSDELHGLKENYEELFEVTAGEDWDTVLIGLDPKTLNSKQKALRSLVVEAVQDMEDLEIKRDKMISDADAEEKRLTDNTKALAQAVVDGTISIRDIQLWNYDLAESVKATIPSIKEEADAIEELNDAVSGDTDKKPAQTVNELEEELAKKLKTVMTSYRNLSKVKDENGKSMKDEAGLLSELRDLYIEYAKEGLDNTSDAMGAILMYIQNLTQAEGEEISSEKRLQKELSNTLTNYQMLADAGDSVGQNLVSEKEMVDTLTDMYVRYYKEGVDPTCDSMLTLKSIIEEMTGATIELGKATESTNEEFKDLLDDTMVDFFKNSTRNGIGDLGKGLGNLFEDFQNKGKNLESIAEKIKEIESQETSALEKQSEAQKELALERERGDSIAIARAEEKLRLANEQVEAVAKTKGILEKEKKGIEDNSTAWKALGNTCIDSLVATLEGLGAQLAALAATSLFGGHIVGSIGAATASLAAYSAAGYIRSQKFERGGIVGGTSYTGDHTIVRANAGELVLNISQQETLARILEASVALAELSASGATGGGGITVNMEGSTIYGLDEPAVGKAIYENIENLKYEGVI